MAYFLYILVFLWFIRTFKIILFWLYLWQLKEYHIGRFLDHFRTTKGRRLIFNRLLLIKILLLGLLAISWWQNLNLGFVFVFLALFLLYFLEFINVFKNVKAKKLKKPILTSKTAILVAGALFIQTLFLIILFFLFKENILVFLFWLLVFDIVTPDVVSIWVVLMEPISILLRHRFIRLACKKRESFKDLQVIGITGSYGKTSTKEFLATILETKFNILKTSGNQNSEMGISQCILQELKPEHKIFICEMGAYNKGGIKLLCNIVKPKIGIITGVNEQHLALFGSMENLLSAEGGKELIDSLPENGIVFLNAQNHYCQELSKKVKIKKFLYGENVNFRGEENILGAMAVAKELGMSQKEISQAVKKIKNKFPGIEIKKTSNGLNIIDATYSANPTGVMAHLDYLKNWSGKKMIIMPCLIELGSACKRIHKQIGEKIGEICDLAIIITKDKFQEIKQGAIEKEMSPDNILFLEKQKEILEKLKDFSGQNDVILLEGRLPKQLIKEIESI